MFADIATRRPGRRTWSATATLAAAVTLASVCNGAAADTTAVVDAVARRAPELLSRYIAIDTVNPPGNELEGARFLERLLVAEGIEARVLESMPGRGNLFARLPGNGKARPIVLLSHIDVVAADESLWEHPPFEGRIADGFVHGRGALDCKGVAITQALAVIALSKIGDTLDRDIILLATAGEETGGAPGAGWMVENHLDLFADAEFLLNEGAFIRREKDRPLIYRLSAAEKGPCWFTVVAEGKPGHASRPPEHTAVTRLVAALSALVAWERPLEVGPVVAGYYAGYARFDPEHADDLRDLASALANKPEFRSWFLSDPAAAALVRNTLTPTVLRASTKTNVLPARASAEVDARLLPGHSCEEFLAEARGVVKNVDGVRLETGSVAFGSSSSPLDNALTRAVEALAAAEGEPAVVLPTLLGGFTDSHYFRDRGIAAYGFTPIVITGEQRSALHGPNERVEIDELQAGVHRMVDLLKTIAH